MGPRGSDAAAERPASGRRIDDAGEQGQDRGQGDGQRPHRTARARTAGQGGHHREDHRRPGQAQRAHVEKRPRPHRGPAQDGQHEEPEQDGDAGARGGVGRAPHARGRPCPRRRLTPAGR